MILTLVPLGLRLFLRLGIFEALMSGGCFLVLLIGGLIDFADLAGEAVHLLEA